MVRHVIIWDLRDELDEMQRAEAKKRIKASLESLAGVIKGAKEIKVYTDMLDTSDGDIMLDSLFENKAALAYYADHPEHIKVKEYIGTVVKQRKCADLEIC